MKKSLVTLASLFAAALPSLSHAADAAPTPEYTFTGNMTLASDYRFRGISQTDKLPTIQGGIDFAHSSGFYLGNWNSNVDADFYNGANIEMDFYGGFKNAIGDFGYDVGVLHYYYPGSDRNTTGFRIKNTEIYVGGSYGPVSLKFSYPLSDFFSAEKINPAGGDAAGSYYVDLSGTYDLGSGFGLVGHVGYQKLKGAARLTDRNGSLTSSYTDWKLGVTYSLPNAFVLGASYIDTNRDYLGVPDGNGSSKNISGSTLVVSLSKTF
jgi:uncharacterized protein (TIGR02001 family)